MRAWIVVVRTLAALAAAPPAATAPARPGSAAIVANAAARGRDPALDAVRAALREESR